MEAGGPQTSDRWSAVERLIECPICSEQYTDPRHLDCEHTFCLRCIEPLIQSGNVACSVCKAITKVGEIPSLKRDMLVVKLLSIGEQNGNDNQTNQTEEDQHCQNRCGFCEDIEQLVNWCKTCNLHLCKKCSKTHKKFTGCQKSHLVSIEVVMEQSRSKIRDSFRSVADMLLKFEGVTNMIFNFDTRKENMKSEIQSHFDNLLFAIDAHKLTLFNKVDTYYAEKEYEVVNHKIEIQKKNAELTQLKDDLNLVRQFDTPSFIDAKVKETVEHLAAYLTYMTNASLLEGKLSEDMTLIKTTVEDLQLDKVGICGSSEGTFQFVVENVSKMKRDIHVYSPRCMISKLPWQIMMGPGTPATTYSVYLFCNKDSSTTTWSCRASVELKTLNLDPTAAPHNKLVEHDRLFDNKENNWGLNSFLNWDHILDPVNGFIKDDKIILEARVSAGGAQEMGL